MTDTPDPGPPSRGVPAGAGGTADSYARERAGGEEVRALDPGLRRLYAEYRRRQASALLGLLSRETIRPLYARAREWASARGVHDGKDPLATLLRYCQEILPLPPFDVWVRDRRENPVAHLREESGWLQGEAPEAVTVEVRSVRLGEERWTASLRLFHRDGAWRGYISFRDVSGNRTVRTADIFREEEPGEIRRRFLSFRPDTLQAFLRSTLP